MNHSLEKKSLSCKAGILRLIKMNERKKDVRSPCE